MKGVQRAPPAPSLAAIACYCCGGPASRMATGSGGYPWPRAGWQAGVRGSVMSTSVSGSQGRIRIARVRVPAPARHLGPDRGGFPAWYDLGLRPQERFSQAIFVSPKKRRLSPPWGVVIMSARRSDCVHAVAARGADYSSTGCGRRGGPYWCRCPAAVLHGCDGVRGGELRRGRRGRAFGI